MIKPEILFSVNSSLYKTFNKIGHKYSKNVVTTDIKPAFKMLNFLTFYQLITY